MGTRRWLFVVLLLSIVAMVVSRFVGDDRPHQDSPAIGKPAPQIDLVLLSDDLTLEPLQRLPEGRVTLVHFWGTWCGPCRMEYPHLSKMTSRFRAQERFQFVPVTCEYGPDETFEGLWSKTNEYLSEGEFGSVAFADPRGVTRRSVAERLERRSLYYPTSILIDTQGTIAGVWEGYTPHAVEQIELAADRLIAEGG